MKEKQRNDTRTLIVHGNQWEYKIGRNTVAIYDPEGNRYFPKFTEIMGDRSLPNYSPHMNPAKVIESMIHKLEPPILEEAHNIIVIS